MDAKAGDDEERDYPGAAVKEIAGKGVNSKAGAGGFIDTSSEGKEARVEEEDPGSTDEADGVQDGKTVALGGAQSKGKVNMCAALVPNPVVQGFFPELTVAKGKLRLGWRC